MTLLFVLFYIHAIFLLTSNSQALFKEKDKTSFKTLCSTNCQDFGKSNDEKGFPLYTCSCSPSCSTFGDCCYDSPYRNETKRGRLNSICVSVFERGGQYRVISGCPANQLSKSCHDSIGHLPPVTSKTTNTTYANIHCATCNRDGDNVTAWNVQLRCSSHKKDDIEDNDSSVLIYHSNYIWRRSKSTNEKSLCMYHVHSNDFSLIDGLELRSCVDEKKISDCSSSWRDTDIKKLCRSYEDPLYFGRKLFKNVHCAQCNYMDLKFGKCMPFTIEAMLKKGLLDPSVIQFCQSRGSKECIQYLSKTGKGVPYSFSDVMNINEVECVPEGKRCCPGERYDFMSKRCRRSFKRG